MKHVRTGGVLLATFLLLCAVSCSKGNPAQTAEVQSPTAASSVAEAVSNQPAQSAGQETAKDETPDLSKKVSLKFNLAYGNRSRTMTYNQGTPLTLSNGGVVTAGMLKPMWQRLAGLMNADFVDVTIQDAKATDMIKTESTSGFSGANIYGGNSIATELMNYGTQGRFVSLSKLIEQGDMPNFKRYLDENPNIKSSITAYNGNIYFVPYIAEIGTLARVFTMRESWVTRLLDAEGAQYDQNEFETYYDAFYVGDNARVGDNGGSVSPKQGVVITKRTAENIIDIQNKLPRKNGKTLTEALVSYIKRNYVYEHPSQLFLGENAAYDIDELIALFRCIKANPTYLTMGKASEVWPLFPRQSSYREDLLRLSTYWGGERVHGSDSYESRWEFDAEGQVVYTYSKEGIYDDLIRLSQMNAEGLIYRDCYDLTYKSNIRTALYGTDGAANPAFGFMTYDWIASTTADALNKDVVVALSPVANVNGVWQYYLDNTRVIKPDGWAISVAGSTPEQIERAAAVFDFFFTEEGRLYQNYGLIEDLDQDDQYVGPDGKAWPKYKNWVVSSAAQFANGDLSTFLRDWIGSQMPIGYQKEIGFEYQYTSERGFEGWRLILDSSTGIPSYEGTGSPGLNGNYYRLVPPAFSMTQRQREILNGNTSLGGADEVEYMFNIVRYGTLGNAPNGVVLPKSYNDYLSYFKGKGLEQYQSIHQAAYANMQAAQ